MSVRVYGNRLLKTLSGLDTRPTPARVRQAVFNIWQGSIADCRWLDLCTGSGAMGAEALGRGAALAIGIEQSGKAYAVIQQNWQQIAKAEQTFQVIRGDVLQKLPSLTGQQFDRIYFDPPYASNLYEPVLEAISRYQLLAPMGEVAAEHGCDRAMPDQISSLLQVRQKIYGSTGLSFYSVQKA